jgi:hypothetical protein
MHWFCIRQYNGFAYASTMVLHTISVTLLIKYCFCILDSVLYEIRYSKHTVAIQMHLGRYCSSQSSQVLSPFFYYFWCRCKSLKVLLMRTDLISLGSCVCAANNQSRGKQVMWLHFNPLSSWHSNKTWTYLCSHIFHLNGTLYYLCLALYVLPTSLEDWSWFTNTTI